MRSFFYFIFLLGFTQLSMGQTSLKAKQLLDKVSETMSSYVNIYFEFTYTLNNKKEGIRQETSGNLTVQGEQYKLYYLDVIQILNEGKVYTIVPENEEVTILNENEEESNFGINPKKLLYFYQSGYDYQWDVRQRLSGRTIQFVKLIPSNENEEVKYLLLGIDTKVNHIYKLIEVGKNDTQTTLTIRKQKENVVLDADFFDFKLEDYPDYYIIE